MKTILAAMIVVIAAVAVMAAQPETKTEGKTFAQHPLAKRAAEVSVGMTSNVVQSLIGKGQVDEKGNWIYTEDDGKEKTVVTVRFMGGGKTVLELRIRKELSEAYWLHEPPAH